MAHAADKKVILLSQEDAKEAPADVRHYEFINYALSDDKAFLAKLDNALQNVFATRYDTLYDRAKVIFKDFREETKMPAIEASKERFISRISSFEKTRDLPAANDEYGLCELLLPRIIADSSDFKVMRDITEWLQRRFPQLSITKPM
jgi:hypothetical protein